MKKTVMSCPNDVCDFYKKEHEVAKGEYYYTTFMCAKCGWAMERKVKERGKMKGEK